MAEEEVQDEKLSEEVKNDIGAPGEKVSLTSKLTKALLTMRNKLPIGKGKSGAQPEAKAKKEVIAAPRAFSTLKIDLKSINQVLVVVCIGLAALMIYVVSRQRPDISSVAAAVSKIKFSEVNTNMITDFQQLTSYVNQIKKRDIFKEYVEKKPEPPPVDEPELEPEPPPPPEVTLQEKAKNLKLMGISWGDNPKAIISDTGAGEVYFVREGALIEGTDITVKEIGKETVIISSEDDELPME